MEHSAVLQGRANMLHGHKIEHLVTQCPICMGGLRPSTLDDMESLTGLPIERNIRDVPIIDRVCEVCGRAWNVKAKGSRNRAERISARYVDLLPQGFEWGFLWAGPTGQTEAFALASDCRKVPSDKQGRQCYRFYPNK